MDQSSFADDTVTLADLIARLRRRWPIVLGLTLAGLALGFIFVWGTSTRLRAITSSRIAFGFPGFERGTYPNGAKFQPDDLRAPDIVNEALKRVAMQNTDPALASKIRGALGVSGFVSPNIIKERERLRAIGQTLPPYVADEYEISLSLPRTFAIDTRQRELLLEEIVQVYLEKFRRNFVELPPDFGNVFASLRNSDYLDYELVLIRDLQAVRSYLEQRVNTDQESKRKDDSASPQAAKQFRSPTNNLSFQDLIKETDLFIQLKLNDVLSQIYTQGLSKDRRQASLKMDYYLRTLSDEEQRLQQEQAVILGLLAKTQERAQNYVVATKQQPTAGQTILDQGFIDSLLANDAYNFLVRRALTAGIAVARVQADRARVQERRSRIEKLVDAKDSDHAAALVHVQQAMAEVERDYNELLGRIRVVLDDYARQEFADAVRITMQARTGSLAVDLLLGAFSGALAAGILAIGVCILKPLERSPRR